VTRSVLQDTIVAVATPPGRGALAIVRLSGPGSITIGSRLVHPWPDAARESRVGRMRDADGEPLDEVVAVWYRAPHSFTAEDAVEVTCHGGTLTPAAIMAAFVALGARPASGGEFTRRAVLNGRLDILQAEAVGDLVDAGTRAAQRVALSQLDGGLSRRIAALREQVLQLEALTAYDIDFPEEDDGPIPRERILGAADALIADVGRLLATAPVGEIAREGAVAVIAGAPNVGKSSLFNALLGRRRAIVTDVAGTTRDAIEAVTEARDWPIRLVDTAGLRESDDTVERIGIEVAHDYVGRADVVILCGDSDTSLAEARRAVAAETNAPVVAVRTKADLAGSRRSGDALWVSAESGEGLSELLGAVAQRLDHANGPMTFDAPMVTRERHRVALTTARDEIGLFREQFATNGVPPLVAAVHLRDATRRLEELIGAVNVEQVLDRVFSSFCVGK
jgi:tRNA modification GTPase